MPTYKLAFFVSASLSVLQRWHIFSLTLKD